MKLLEHEGIDLLEKYGINVPKRDLLENVKDVTKIYGSVVLKAQVLSWDRKRAGGVVFSDNAEDAEIKKEKLFGSEIHGEKVKNVLVQEKLDIDKEFYISFSYDTDSRAPVLALSIHGGTGIHEADVFQIDMVRGVSETSALKYATRAGFMLEDAEGIVDVIVKLWKLFIDEFARIAEINPLVRTTDGKFVAVDAKVTIDGKDEHWSAGQTVEMDGDIAIIASSGGASLLNLDTLMRVGGKPANYTEYGGNPPADVVIELTGRVLGREDIKGLWVIGGTASFTDVYETLGGFVEGLRRLKEKPDYPIVIRRDGPRKKEAFEMLEKVRKEEGYDFHLYDSHTPMAETAKIIVDLAYGK